MFNLTLRDGAWIYIQLKFFESLLGVIVLTIFIYFSGEVLPATAIGSGRLFDAIEEVVGLILYYYFVFGYFLVSALLFFLLSISRKFSRFSLAAINGLGFGIPCIAISTIYSIGMMRPIFLVWLGILLFDFVLPYHLVKAAE